MAQMDINFDNLALAEQVLRRQSKHGRAIAGHLHQYANLEATDLGLILQLFKPLNDGALSIADTVYTTSSRVFEAGAERMGETRQAYIDAEREASQRIAEVMSQLGARVSPFSSPATPVLGAATNSAPPRYGEPDGNLFKQGFLDGYGSVEWTQDTSARVEQRVRDGLGAQRSVTEVTDVGSYLPVPVANEPEVENVRWNAGIIFGGVDWVFEQLFGFSLLEEITKPFVGNWTKMSEGSIAWKHASDATRGISQNAAGLCPPLASWKGRGSEAFVLAAAAMSQAHDVIAGPAGNVSTALQGLAAAAKLAAKLILKLLEKLQNKLLRLAAEAAVPVVGWIAAAIEAGISIAELAEDVRFAYGIVNTVYDLVSGMASTISNFADSVLRITDLVEALGRGVAARAL